MILQFMKQYEKHLLILNDTLNQNENIIISILKEKPFVNQQTISELSGISIAHTKRIMKSLQEKGLLFREGGKKFGKWICLKKI